MNEFYRSLFIKAESFFIRLQQDLINEFSDLEQTRDFVQEKWTREPAEAAFIQNGSGITSVLTSGDVFEKAGINFSTVGGVLPASMSKTLIGQEEELPFSAAGVSLVIHPFSPLVPTTHANVRVLQVADKIWFGGGADLTPFYLAESDIIHFHQTYKSVCDRFDPQYYPDFKERCDQYFYLPHRAEARGIGGIFFDYLGRDGSPAAEQLKHYFSFMQAVGKSFSSAYLPIVRNNAQTPFTPEQKAFQLERRGRYVEFNLLTDRGTKFGLETGGRTESILMSMPPAVHWNYQSHYAPGTPEAKIIEILKNPRDWV